MTKKKRKNNIIKTSNENVKHDISNKQKLTPKVIISRSLQVILVISIFATIAIGYGYYRNTHHGYSTSQKTIKEYVNAWGNNYPALIQLCFDSNSDIYKDTVMQAVEERQLMDESISIEYKDIQIIEKDFDDIDKLVSESGNTDITAAKTSLVEIPITQIISDEDSITTVYYYEFITYIDTNGKWLIHNFKLLTRSTQDSTETFMEIGDKDTGFISIPSNWTKVTTQQKSDYISKDITYMSPNNETISLLAMSSEIQPTDMVKLACESLTSQDMAYTVDENVTLNNNKCTLITGVSSNGMTTSILWIFSSPLIDNYTHYIELSCLTTNSEQYIDYISSYILR